LILAALELAAFYGLFCLSENTGSLVWYLFTTIFFIQGVKNFFKALRILVHGGHKAS
jgi:hypothetical protein